MCLCFFSNFCTVFIVDFNCVKLDRSFLTLETEVDKTISTQGPLRSLVLELSKQMTVCFRLYVILEQHLQTSHPCFLEVIKRQLNKLNPQIQSCDVFESPETSEYVDVEFVIVLPPESVYTGSNLYPVVSVLI